jgi:hypothetical protein
MLNSKMCKERDVDGGLVRIEAGVDGAGLVEEEAADGRAGLFFDAALLVVAACPPEAGCS